MNDLSNILDSMLQAEQTKEEWRSHVLDLTEDVPEPMCAIQIGGVDCLPLGEIIGIKGRAKVGKSQLIYYLTGIILGDRQTDIVRSNDKDLSILIADTEQSKGSFAQCLRRSLRYAGLSEHENVERLTPLYLKDVETDKRCEVIEQAIGAVNPALVVIDGVRDLLHDFNSLEESDGLIAWLQRITATYGCAVICILHQNKDKSDTNMRGHLGTELVNKLYTCWEVSKIDGNFTVKCSDTRGGDIPDLSFRLDEYGNFAAAQLPSKPEKSADMIQTLKKCLSHGGLSYDDLVAAYSQEAMCSERTAKRHLGDARKNNYIENTNGIYTLTADSAIAP